MATKKVSIKNYKKAEYKTQLTTYEYNEIVSSTISGIIGLYDKGLYGFNTFTLNSSLVSVCTNIDMDVNDVDVKTSLFEDTDVITNIVNNIGENIYNRILNEIDLGLRYRISTNPETKLLIAEITNFIKNLSNVSQNVTDETLNNLFTSVKEITGINQYNED